MSTITKTSAFKRKQGVDRDVRSMLIALGMGQYNTSFLTTAMFLMPRTTDPAAQATQFIIQGAQNGLMKLGAPIRGTGVLDRVTMVALRKLSGPLWLDKTWVQIYGDVLDALESGKSPNWGSSSTKVDLSDYVSMGDDTTNFALGVLAVGGVLLVASFL